MITELGGRLGWVLILSSSWCFFKSFLWRGQAFLRLPEKFAVCWIAATQIQVKYVTKFQASQVALVVKTNKQTNKTRGPVQEI